MTVEEIRQFRNDLLELIQAQSSGPAPDIEAISTLVTEFTTRLENEVAGAGSPGLEERPRQPEGMARGKGDL